MHILIFEFNGGVIVSENYRVALKNMGITYKLAGYCFDDTNSDDFFSWRFTRLLDEERFDAVFSVNYFPLIAKCCHSRGIKYLAWSFDCPLNAERVEETLGLETNNLFLFDREHVLDYRKKGFDRVYHLPLAVNSKQYDNMRLTPAETEHYGAQVSFVGGFYKSDLGDFMQLMSDYDRGFIEALCNAQTELYGCFLAKEPYVDDLIERVNRDFARNPMKPPAINRDWFEYEMAKVVTARERVRLVKVLSHEFDMKLYSTECPSALGEVRFMGTCDAYKEAPKVYRASLINISHTLKTIRSGVIQRIVDIMAAGGLAFTNYQSELSDYFEDGTDLVIYDDVYDAVDKARYYLEHPEVADQIRKNGHEIVREFFTYERRFETMFRMADIEA